MVKLLDSSASSLLKARPSVPYSRCAKREWVKSSRSRLSLRHPCRDENFSQLLPVSTGTSKAEITVTASIAMIFGPALPLLHPWPVTKTCCWKIANGETWQNQRLKHNEYRTRMHWSRDNFCVKMVSRSITFEPAFGRVCILVSTIFRGERIYFARFLPSNSTCQKLRGEIGKTERAAGSFFEVMFCLKKHVSC